MAENYNEQGTNVAAPVETTDRGFFGFGKKKDDDDKKAFKDDKFANEFENKVAISEPVVPEYKHDEVEKHHHDDEVEKHHHDTLLEKFHKSDDHEANSSSASSSDEEDDEEKKRRKREKKEKKGLKEKLKEKLPGHGDDVDTEVPISRPHVEETVYSEPSHVTPHSEENVEKKGFVGKIKEKLSGEKKVDEHHDVIHPIVNEPRVEVEGGEKKGFMDKIKEKIPGLSHKDAGEKKDHEFTSK